MKGEIGMKIRRLRTDNGREFISDDFFCFCLQLGIRRQLSCAETPQQNGSLKENLDILLRLARAGSMPRICLNFYGQKV